MPGKTIRHIGALMAVSLLLAAGQAAAQGNAGAGHAHDHGHDHAHDHAHDDAVYKGYFEDSQVSARALSDWEGDWQSVYPLLADGTLDPVLAHKAEHGEKSAEDYRAYYETGYKTDVERITIEGDSVTFHRGGESVRGRYADDGHEILTYEAGNRGVRYVFRKIEGDAAAPQFIQFSDHAIAPVKAGHYHLYWGNDRAALLKEVSNWPTYYPAALSKQQIVEEMLAH
ncbi:metal-binding protein ZinT [Paracoccus binzhouensis]|uniref:metal-binding protein ZinT n=1 Tax=Paracoccus binzhouensis TaxID=2796149 RepID=UPI001E56BE09|nr:metal-binding protein ZinT [Paracoccus binzhouensis]